MRLIKKTNDSPYAIETAGPGIPPLKSSQKPWEGLSRLVSMTSSVLDRDTFGRMIKKD